MVAVWNFGVEANMWHPEVLCWLAIIIISPPGSDSLQSGLKF